MEPPNLVRTASPLRLPVGSSTVVAHRRHGFGGAAHDYGIPLMTILSEVPRPPSIVPTERELMASWGGNLDEPLLTIKCITYNQISFIRDALNSFLMQRTDFPFRIVVHDDASADGTQEVIKHYSANYPRVIKAVLQEKNLMSRGLKNDPYVNPLVAGKYIAFCEGDDYWIDPHKLQRQVDFLSVNPGYAASTENAMTFFTETRRIEAFSRQPEHDVSITELLGARPFATASVVCRKFALAGRTRALRYAGDIGTWCYLATKGRIKYHPIYSSVYRRGKHGVVLGTDPFKWARKMEDWNHDVARFLANQGLDQVFRERIFEGYRSACSSRQQISLSRFMALAKAFQNSPWRTIKFVSGAGPIGRLATNSITTRFKKWRDIRADKEYLETVSRENPPDQSIKTATNVIVSLVSGPARIKHASMAIESLLKQSVVPGKIVLILAEGEFQQRMLPKSIRLQINRGLEIAWVERPIHRYQKTSLTASLFPGCDVVTADDGILYPADMIESLIDATRWTSEVIVGRSGWEMQSFDGVLLPSRLWSAASSRSLGSSLMLTGRAGVLFPAAFLRSMTLDKRLSAMDPFAEAEDLWTWAAALQERIPCRCLGRPSPYEMVSQERCEEKRLGTQEFDGQLAKLIKHRFNSAQT